MTLNETRMRAVLRNLEDLALSAESLPLLPAQVEAACKARREMALREILHRVEMDETTRMDAVILRAELFP